MPERNCNARHACVHVIPVFNLIIGLCNLMGRDVAHGDRSPLPLALLIPPPLHGQGGPCGEEGEEGVEVDGDVDKWHTQAGVSSLWSTSNATGRRPNLVHQMTVRDTCPACSVELEEEEVRRGWRADAQDYTTACSRCEYRFVPRFTVRSFHATHNVSHGPQDNLGPASADKTGEGVAEGVATCGARAVASTDDGGNGRDGRVVDLESKVVYFQCLSPLVVHKEVATLLRDLGSVSPSPRPLSAGNAGIACCSECRHSLLQGNARRQASRVDTGCRCVWQKV